jgi:hypothetical protein
VQFVGRREKRRAEKQRWTSPINQVILPSSMQLMRFLVQNTSHFCSKKLSLAMPMKKSTEVSLEKGWLEIKKLLK